MEKIYSETDLNNAIQLLEGKQAIEEMKLKEQFHYTYESLKPLNIIKNIFKQASESESLKVDIINNSIGVTAGYFSKMVFEKTANSPLKKLVGSAVMFSVKSAIANNPEVVNLMINGFLNLFGSKKSKSK